MTAFDELDKGAKPAAPKKMEWTVTKEPKKIDWHKIAMMVLKMIEKELPPHVFRAINMVVNIALKKRSKFETFCSIALISGLQIAGVYQLIQLVKIVINLF